MKNIIEKALHYEVIHPKNNKKVFWDIFITVLIILTTIVTPSKITFGIGIILDSTERVIKNQKIPKAIILYFLNIKIDVAMIALKNKKLKNVLNESRLVEMG